jgi:hypothetical protein
MIETKDLELVVTERIEGSLLTNALQIRDFVVERVRDYSPDKYVGKVKEAKDDRAVLNKAAKELNAKRLDLERQFMAPFQEFKNVISETVSAIKDASDKIGTIITQVEEQERRERRDEIEAAYVDSGFTLVSLGRLLDQTWLNKSTSTKKWREELAAKIEKIESDLVSLDSIEDAEEAKAFYLETLDIGRALQHAQSIKENREALKGRQEPEPDVPRDEAPGTDPETPETEPTMSSEYAQEQPGGASPEPQSPGDVKEELLHTVTLELHGTRSKLAALRKYIDVLGTTYRKIEKVTA